MKILFKSLIVISWLYCLGYILLGFPNENVVIRALTGIMSLIFSCSLLFFLLKSIDNKIQKK